VVLDSTGEVQGVRTCPSCNHEDGETISVPVVISWLQQSSRSKIALGADEVLSVEDEIMCGEEPVLVTSIESKGRV